MNETSFFGKQSAYAMALMIGPCDRVREFLLEYLEHRLPPLTALRFAVHLRVCPRCGKYLEGYKRASEFGRQSLADPPPKELVELTLKFLDEHLPERRPPGDL